jgi:hypothetical protein
MPLHIDIKINDNLIRRVHITRMTHNGMKPDSVNEYSVVVAEKESVLRGGRLIKEFKECPDWWEWEVSEIRFHHRYGDDELTCLMKALEAVKTHENKSLKTTP